MMASEVPSHSTSLFHRVPLKQKARPLRTQRTPGHYIIPRGVTLCQPSTLHAKGPSLTSRSRLPPSRPPPASAGLSSGAPGHDPAPPPPAGCACSEKPHRSQPGSRKGRRKGRCSILQSGQEGSIKPRRGRRGENTPPPQNQGLTSLVLPLPVHSLHFTVKKQRRRKITFFLP